MKTLSQQDIAFFREQGYLHVPGVFDAATIERLLEGYDYIEDLVSGGSLREEYLTGKGCEVHIHVQSPNGVTGPEAVRYLRKVQWPSLIHPAFEAVRTDPRFVTLLEPLIGSSLKQYINQINFKHPGGDIAFPWHQDIRPMPAFIDQVDNYVQTIIAVDEATVDNGCLHIVPGSHRLGNLKVQRYAEGQIEQQADVSSAVPCPAAPGDVLMFTSYTVHGSEPNRTERPRRSYINGFVRASACTVGKWAFLEGRGVPITSDTDYGGIRAGGPVIAG